LFCWGVYLTYRPAVLPFAAEIQQHGFGWKVNTSVFKIDRGYDETGLEANTVGTAAFCLSRTAVEEQ
jgi:hypothetical protein